MSENNEVGVTFNSRTIPVYLGMISLGVALYTGISSLNAYAFEVEKVQTEQQALRNISGELKTTVKGLNDNIVSLTIVLNRVEDRYNQMEIRLDKIEHRITARK